jgi:hypothetical protein
MTQTRTVAKAALLAGVAALGLNLATAGLAQARRPLKVEVTPIAAPPAPPPAITLSTHALQDASAFRNYAKHAEAVSAAFKNGDGVEQSLAIGAAYEPQQLARGAIAYAALLALQDPTFVSGVRTYAADANQRHELAQRLVQDPRYVIAFPGAANAAGLIVATMGTESSRMSGVAAQVKQAAYSVQHSAWSKTKVINPAARLAQTKTLSGALMSSMPDDVAQLQIALNGANDPAATQILAAHGQPIQGPYAPVVERGMALAALAALGEAGDVNDAAVQSVTTEPTDGACLQMSKLNLYQCLAVAVPWYEDIFCLGEHALSETSQCIAKESGTPAQMQQALAAPVGLAPATATAGAVAPVAVAATHP